MTEQFLREWQVTVAGKTFSGNLRVAFNVQSASDTGILPHATIILYNVTGDSANAIMKASEKRENVTLLAGYQGNVGKIFSGEIIQVNLGKENATDTYATIFAQSNDKEHNSAYVNQTLKPGATGMDKYKALLKTMPGIEQGRIPEKDLEKLIYPRALTMFGPTRYFMDILARTVGGTFHFDVVEKKLHITKTDDKGTGSAIIMNSDTGMIGLPTETSYGIMLRCLLNPRIKAGSIIHIKDSSIQRITPDFTLSGAAKNVNPLERPFIDPDGLYRVLFVEQTGDSYGEPWFTECNCKGLSQPRTKSQIKIPVSS